MIVDIMLATKFSIISFYIDQKYDYYISKALNSGNNFFMNNFISG